MRRRLQRLLSTRPRKIIAVAVVVVLVAAIALVVWPDSEPEPVASRDVQVTVPGGPGVAEPVTLDATLYLPEQIPAPAILMAHGFGGSKRSLAADAEQSARDGFVVLAYSARGFGRSTGQIALDSLDYEIPDARGLVDWLATQSEVQLDGPGDPRMGVTGGSYGGALSLMLAGTDPRVDALVPLITWNDLSQALFPNAQATPDDLAAPTPAAAEGVADGVFKKLWASTLIASVTTGASLSASPTGIAQGDSGDSGFIRRGGSGTQTSAAPTPAAETDDGAETTPGATGGAAAAAFAASCGRLSLALCAAYSQAAQTGRITPELQALLDRSSPKEVVGNITAPTLLVQGERDTLFGLEQADANARAIAANGGVVAVTWYNGGHDGGSPDSATRTRMNEWFQHFLRGAGPVPSTAFRYTVDGPISDTGRARSRTLEASTYPGLGGDGATPRDGVPVGGDPQFVVNPPGAAPAAISTLPGLSGIASTAIATFLGGLPGQTARFTSAPVSELTVLAGTPRITVDVARIPVPEVFGGAAAETDDGAVLFASLAKVGDQVGLSVLAWDYRGYGKSEGLPDEANTIADARQAQLWLAKRAGVRPEEVIVAGRSLGGGVAIGLAAKHTVRALVLDRTFAGLVETARYHFPWLPVNLIMRNRFDSLDAIKRYRGPLLQAHGTDDEVIPIDMGRRLFDAAPSAHKRFVTVEGGRHNDPQTAEFYQAASEFLDSLPPIASLNGAD